MSDNSYVTAMSESKCDDCKVVLKAKVCRSAAGWYVGTWCGCGPYSRESDYFDSEEAAKAELDSLN